MKLSRLAAGMGLAVILSAVAVAAEPLTSGPQVDDKVVTPFAPLNINGESAGEMNCLVCQNQDNPVVMIFAREVTPELTKLVKRVDQITGKHKDAQMGSFVVFCRDEEGLKDQLKSMARDQELKNLVLSVWLEPKSPDAPNPIKKYRVNKDADVTVVLYTDNKVKANYAFRKGELTEKDVDAIVAAVPEKILPKN
jgi:hypothetical protein